jgi:hypothetical protein
MFLDVVPQSVMDGDHQQIAIDDPRSDHSSNGIPIKLTKTSEMQTLCSEQVPRGRPFYEPSNIKSTQNGQVFEASG